MPSSEVATFADPDDYAASVRANVDLTVNGRGRFAAKITRIGLHRLWVERLSDNLPRTAHVANMGGLAIVGFRTSSGSSLLRAGREMLATNIVRHAERETYYHRSSGATGLGVMWLPSDDMGSIGAVAAGCDLAPARDAMFITPAPAAMARLQRLHAAAGRLAEEAPEIIANPDAARGLEQALIEAMVGCFAHQDGAKNEIAYGQHALVMRRFRRVLEENADQPIYIPEICRAVRVSERTLRACCQEHLGMSPKRYLLLRRMHMARRALRDRARTATTVTEVATQYGFWQLGRFAVEYRGLFGESPSATLRRTADRSTSTCRNCISPGFCLSRKSSCQRPAPSSW
jgi:AraC-like DNA-binding protein